MDSNADTVIKTDPTCEAFGTFIDGGGEEMRLLEILLSLANLLTCCMMAIPQFRATYWMGYVAVITVLIAGIQILFEGSRWEMVPAYTLTIIFFIWLLSLVKPHGIHVRICLQVLIRKCFCDVSTCARKIKASRLTPFVEPLARVTTRLFQVVQAIGLADFRYDRSAFSRAIGNTNLLDDRTSPDYGTSHRTS